MENNGETKKSYTLNHNRIKLHTHLKKLFWRPAERFDAGSGHVKIPDTFLTRQTLTTILAFIIMIMFLLVTVPGKISCSSSWSKKALQRSRETRTPSIHSYHYNNFNFMDALQLCPVSLKAPLIGESKARTSPPISPGLSPYVHSWKSVFNGNKI
uniref:Uncharacterized protein n=1 Tax=Glossina pallidipes TaxID=7398 RepID=A0A1B0A7X7_GLOPL